MYIFSAIGQYILMLKSMFSKPENWKMYWKEFMSQCVAIGIGSLGIVAIISVFMGAVSAVQTAYQITSPLVPKTSIAQIVRDTMILEFSPTLICIVLAGVVGSKIASELGNMRVSEQIDALEIMGINPKSYLILPKIVGALTVIPLLIIISIALGIWGGRLAATLSGITSPEIFDAGLLLSFSTYNVFVGLCKAYVFSFIVSSVPSYHGYYVKGGALEIGKAGTTSVIVSCILILLADYIIAALLL